MTHSHPIIILGPTAGGKSELAVELAERLAPHEDAPGGEIVSADSMQVYRGLDAGTAKPSPGLRQRIPHHLIDVVEPTQPFTVAHWLELARNRIAAIQDRGKRPIIVGGTNLYLRALLEGLMPGPEPDHPFRRTLAGLSDQQLHGRLKEVDARAADRIFPADRKRTIRALEVHRQTGQTISDRQVQWDQPEEGVGKPRPEHVLIGLGWDKAVLNRRINARVKRMFFPESLGLSGESLPEETRRLVQQRRLGTEHTPQPNDAIGYKQCLATLRGEMTWDQAFEKTKIATRRFAKQQRTWIKRFRNTHWLEATQTPIEQLAEQAFEAVQGA